MTKQLSKKRITCTALTIGLVLALVPLNMTTVQAQPQIPQSKPAASSTKIDLEKLPWMDKKRTPEARATLLSEAMTKEQLVHMLHGTSDLIGLRKKDGGPKSIGYIPPIPELRVPALVMTDGPSGLRNWEPATQMPAPIVQASSFDVNIANKVGKAIAQDSKDRGQDLLFGPGFNLARNPEAGRTFEYFGEDPLLAGKMAAANVKGLQGQGIMASIKHFVANNQETNRTLSSSNMDARTLHEIYEKPFEIAVKESNPASAMCAYNKINGVYACSNYKTQVQDLRNRMGFSGFVVSDYPATHNATDIRNGLNIELPNGKNTSVAQINKAVAAGKMTWLDVRYRVKETLIQMFKYGLFDHPWDNTRNDRARDMRSIPAARGDKIAQETAEAGSILLKNDGMLPLAGAKKDNKAKKVLIVGEGAKKAFSGGGSSKVQALSYDNLIDQVKAKLPQGSTIEWKSTWNPAGIAIAAKKADYVIVVAGEIGSELLDRFNLDFWPHNNNAINAAANANKNTVVVTQIPGPFLMPWKDKVRAILNVWYPGQAHGKATANLLFGDVNPSGRLPQTFPATNKQKPAQSRDMFPGGKLGFESAYNESVFMGYRWYDSREETPLFPFGYGLSYTSFKYSNAKLLTTAGGTKDSVKVQFTVTNTGKVAGAIAPQVYVGKPASPEIPTPPKELGAFTKVMLNPGEAKTVTLEIPPSQLSVFDVKVTPNKADTGPGDFVVKSGAYKVYVADNATDIKATFDYKIS